MRLGQLQANIGIRAVPTSGRAVPGGMQGRVRRKLWSMQLGPVQGNAGIRAVLDVRRVRGWAVSGGMRGRVRRKLHVMQLGQVQDDTGIRAVIDVRGARQGSMGRDAGQALEEAVQQVAQVSTKQQ